MVWSQASTFVSLCVTRVDETPNSASIGPPRGLKTNGLTALTLRNIFQVFGDFGRNRKFCAARLKHANPHAWTLESVVYVIRGLETLLGGTGPIFDFDVCVPFTFVAQNGPNITKP